MDWFHESLGLLSLMLRNRDQSMYFWFAVNSVRLDESDT